MKIIQFPQTNTKEESLSDEDIVNLVMGMVRLLQRYADSERLGRILELIKSPTT